MLKIGMEEEIKGVSEYWKDLMPMMAMEEAGELIQAISKYIRKGDLNDRRQDLIDEIGDMYISLEAIMRTFEIDTKEVEERIKNKLSKTY